jgi:thiol-disulfide isomerase/thioredoxin
MIKYAITCLVAACMSTAASAQFATISGSSKQSPLREVFLFKVMDGRPERIASCTPGDDGSFGFRFKPAAEGLFLVGTQPNAALAATHTFYIKPGSELNLELDAGGYALTGSNTRENQVLAEWRRRIRPMERKYANVEGNSTFVDYFPDVEALAAEVKAAPPVNTGNAAFDALMPKLRYYDLVNLAAGYLLTPRTQHPKQTDLTPFYHNLPAGELLSNADMLQFPYGDRLIFSLVYLRGKGTPPPAFEEQVKSIPNDTLKGQYALQYMETLKSYEAFRQHADALAPFLRLPRQQKRVADITVKLADTRPGKPGINFAYADLKGRQRALSDYKGKLVLVDVWATWCAPCKAEEPHWEKLTEQYAGKDIVFMGVSVDKDKAAWERYIGDKNLKGLQLHAGPDSDISSVYKISGIPRYMLFDKAGNIIAAESPRPSNASLAKMIDEWLAK